MKLRKKSREIAGLQECKSKNGLCLYCVIPILFSLILVFSHFSPASLNARRKGRKLTSGDSYEPFDELENVGFSEEPDIILLFETSGHFYVHENCATWSEGIKKPAVKDEKESADKTPEKKSGKITEMTGVDLAVKSSVNQKCAYCKHFGASVKCKESGRMYHFPCAAASGSFMYKPTMTLVGTDSLSKVSSFGELFFHLFIYVFCFCTLVV